MSLALIFGAKLIVIKAYRKARMHIAAPSATGVDATIIGKTVVISVNHA